MNLEKLAKATRILKNIPRTGWLQKGVPSYDAESVAEHAFEVAVISLSLLDILDDGVDGEKVLTMALVHDLSEAVIGDAPKALTERISENLKNEIELETVKEITGSRKISEVFQEYVRGESLESKIVRVADKLSTLLQAESYKGRGYSVDEIIEGTRIELEKILKQLGKEDLEKALYNLIGGRQAREGGEVS